MQPNVQLLCDAVSANDAPRVRAILTARPELIGFDLSGGDERRALHFSVLNRVPEMVALLMEHGADARHGVYPYRRLTTPRALALDRRYTELVAIIDDAESKRPPDSAAGAPGLSPLHQAARDHDLPALARLLKAGADANAPTANQWTPLDFAAGFGGTSLSDTTAFQAAAGLLRQSGAHLTPRSAAALGETGWLRQRHADGSLENPVDCDGGMLSLAVKYNQPEVLRLLLDLGFDPDERFRLPGLEEDVYSQAMPLYWAADSGQHAMAELLLAHGADPNGHVYCSGTPTHAAVSRRDRATVDLLTRHGGVVLAESPGYSRSPGLARALVALDEAGQLPVASLNPGRTFGEDLLQGGSSGGDPEIVRMALERVTWGRSDPRWHGQLWNVRCFWNHIPWVRHANPAFDRNAYLECYKWILARADASVSGTFGRTILHDIAAMGDWVNDEEVTEFASAALDAGANPHLRDEFLGSTALGWACQHGRVGMARLLLSRGVDAAEPDAETWATPVARAQKSGSPEILALLRSVGIY